MQAVKKYTLLAMVALLPLLGLAQADSLQTKKGRAGAVSKDTAATVPATLAADTVAKPKAAKEKRKRRAKESDTLAIAASDTAAIQKHSPTKAALMSAVLPGLGQIYNRKYWKLPIVYAAVGTGVYFIISNRTQYLKVKRSYLARIDPTSGYVDAYPEATDNALLESVEYNRKNMELSYVLTGVAYMLNIVDASVDAHLFYFDVSDDLSMRLAPNVFSIGHSNTAAAGFTLRLKL